MLVVATTTFCIRNKQLDKKKLFGTDLMICSTITLMTTKATLISASITTAARPAGPTGTSSTSSSINSEWMNVASSLTMYFIDRDDSAI